MTVTVGMEEGLLRAVTELNTISLFSHLFLAHLPGSCYCSPHFTGGEV